MNSYEFDGIGPYSSLTDINEREAPSDMSNDELRAALVGVWALISYDVELKNTGALIPAMGPNPRGRVIFTEDGWVAFNLEGSDRQSAKTDEDRAELLKTLVSYIGRYRIENGAWITTIESAWIPDWVGTEQKRFVRVIDDMAHVSTPWRMMPNWAPDQLTRSLIKFKRHSRFSVLGQRAKADV